MKAEGDTAKEIKSHTSFKEKQKVSGLTHANTIRPLMMLLAVQEKTW